MTDAGVGRIAGRSLLLAAVAVLTIATAAYGAPAVTVDPDSGLADGDVVQVHGEGFTPGKTLVIVQCVEGAQGQDGCNTDDVVFTSADASGEVDEPFTVRTGELGDGGGRCDADNDCVINVSEPSTDPEAERASATISFAASPGAGSSGDGATEDPSPPTEEAASSTSTDATAAPPDEPAPEDGTAVPSSSLDDMPDTGAASALVPVAALALGAAASLHRRSRRP